MHLSVSGIIINQTGELLVIKRDDTRTWAIPGGSLNAGEDPASAIAREVEEETGFKVLPVRLVQVAWMPAIGQHGMLQFTFRCLLRGGAPRTSRESLAVGYTPTNPPGVRMLRFHRDRLAPLLTHSAPAALFETVRLTARQRIAWFVLTRAFYPLRNRIDRARGLPAYVPPPLWRVTPRIAVRNAAGHVLWVQDGAQQRLPGGPGAAGEAPWESAARLLRAQSGLHVTPDHLAVGVTHADNSLHLLFTASTTELPVAGAFYPPHAPPPAADRQHAALVADLPPAGSPTAFRQAA